MNSLFTSKQVKAASTMLRSETHLERLTAVRDFLVCICCPVLWILPGLSNHFNKVLLTDSFMPEAFPARARFYILPGFAKCVLALLHLSTVSAVLAYITTDGITDGLTLPEITVSVVYYIWVAVFIAGNTATKCGDVPNQIGYQEAYAKVAASMAGATLTVIDVRPAILPPTLRASSSHLYHAPLQPRLERTLSRHVHGHR